MNKKLELFKEKTIANDSMPVIGAKKVPTAGGSINMCDGNNYIYGSDTRRTNWIFRDTVDFDWVGGRP